jgi:hypothetical protein
LRFRAGLVSFPANVYLLLLFLSASLPASLASPQAAQRKKVAEAAAVAAASGAADGLSGLKLSAEAGAAAEMAAATAAPVYGDAASASVRTSTGLLTSEPRSRDVKISSFSLSLYGHVLVRLPALARARRAAASPLARAASPTPRRQQPVLAAALRAAAATLVRRRCARALRRSRTRRLS